MKKIFVIIGVVLSVAAQASTVDSVFRKESPVPAALQSRILDYVKTHCGNLVADSSLVEEVETSVREVSVDQGMSDQYFTTTLSSYDFFDGMHPTTAYITVESAQYSFYNSDNLEVIRVYSNEICN